MQGNDVNAAFEILLKEIELVLQGVNEEGAQALKAGDYDGARRALEKGRLLTDFRERVKALHDEWASLHTNPLPQPSPATTIPQPLRVQPPHPVGRAHHTAGERLPRGLSTPEDAYRRPILEALVDLGGSAEADLVLKIVERKIRDVLSDYDRQYLPSGSDLRWRNKAHWCRLRMVHEGLLRSDSPYGVWEISEMGRQWLRLASQGDAWEPQL